MTAKRHFDSAAKRRSRALIAAANKAAIKDAEEIVANNPEEIIEEKIEQAENPTGKSAIWQRNIDALSPSERATLEQRRLDFERYYALRRAFIHSSENAPTAAEMAAATREIERRYPPVVDPAKAYFYLTQYGLAIDSYPSAVEDFSAPQSRPSPMPASGVRRLPQIFKDKDGTQMQWAEVSGGCATHVLVSTGCDDATTRRIAGASPLGPIPAPSPATVKADAENVAAQDEVQQVVAESQMTPLQRFERFQQERRNEILRLTGRAL